MVNAKMIICQMRFHSSAGQQGVYILTVISWVWKLPNLIDSYYLGLQWINVDTKDLQVIGNSVKMNDEVLITDDFFTAAISNRYRRVRNLKLWITLVR